jgi:hypothetical protein
MTVSLDFELHMLSLNLSQAKEGGRQFDRLIAKVFGLQTTEPWSTRFEDAANLFRQEFPTWSRECLSNSCQGILWTLSSDDDWEYRSTGCTDALALYAALVKARRGEVNL